MLQKPDPMDVKKKARSVLKNVCYAITLQCSLYLIEFIFLPIFIDPSPTDTMISFIVPLVATVCISLIGMFKVVDKFIYWIMSMPVYYLLVKLYCPKGMYGINYDDPMFNLFNPTPISIVAGVILFYEFCVWVVVKIIKVIIRKKCQK